MKGKEKTEFPNYLDYIYLDALEEVKPEAVANRLGDVTERKHAEEELKRYSQKLQELIS